MPYSDGDIGPRRLRNMGGSWIDMNLEDLLDVDISATESVYIPGIVTVAESSTDTDTTSHVISYPSDMTVGNLLLCVLTLHGDGTSHGTWPADWTFLSHSPTGYAYTEVGWHQVTGDEETTFTVTSADAGKAAHIVLEISHAADPDSDPPEIAWGTLWGLTEPWIVDPPLLSMSAGTKFLYLTVCASEGRNSVTVWPTGYDLSQSEKYSAATNAATLALCGKQSITDSDNPSAFTITDSPDHLEIIYGNRATIGIIGGPGDTPADNDLLAFDAGVGYWTNQTPVDASVLGLTTGNQILFKSSDSDTYLKYAANSLRFIIGGSTVLVMSSTGCVMTT